VFVFVGCMTLLAFLMWQIWATEELGSKTFKHQVHLCIRAQQICTILELWTCQSNISCLPIPLLRGNVWRTYYSGLLMYILATRCDFWFLISYDNDWLELRTVSTLNTALGPILVQDLTTVRTDTGLDARPQLNQCFDHMTNPVPGIPRVVCACTILRAEREREESHLIP